MDKTHQDRFRYYCLSAAALLAAIAFLPIQALRGTEEYLAQTYLIIPCMLFLGSLLKEERRSLLRFPLLPGLVFCLWFMGVQILHYFTEGAANNPGYFLCAYLPAFVYPFVVSEERRRQGLRATGIIYMMLALGICLGSFLLLADRIQVPGSHFFWSGVRLNPGKHPNIAAMVLMIGICFCLCRAAVCKKRFGKLLLYILIPVLFCIEALTNARTALLMTSAILAGVCFFRILGDHWKRVLLALPAALVIFVSLYACATALYNANEQRLTEQYYAKVQTAETQTDPAGDTESAPEAQADRPPSSGDRTLKRDLHNLNHRSEIWAGAFRAMKDNSEILLYGRHYVGETVGYYASMKQLEHTHNSLVETLMRFGIPGLAVALYFCFLTLRNGLYCLFWQKDPIKRCAAMLAMSMLVCGMLEPLLFTGDKNFYQINFFYFLLSGYLQFWYQNRNADAGI